MEKIKRGLSKALKFTAGIAYYICYATIAVIMFVVMATANMLFGKPW